jgi:asparagine synthase (glutamine-hydrolysing)
MKIRDGRGKHILRQLLYREVPRHLVERPKAGFGIPVGEWIKGPLRPWAEDLLDPNTMRDQGFFDPDIVQRRWRDHLAGRRDSTAAIWAILMFQSWLEANSGTSAAELPPAAMAVDVLPAMEQGAGLFQAQLAR